MIELKRKKKKKKCTYEKVELAISLSQMRYIDQWNHEQTFKNDHNIRAHNLQYCYCKKRDVLTEECKSQLSSKIAQAR